MAYRAGFVAVVLALAGVTASTPADAVADGRSEARAVRAERAAGDGLLDNAQTAAPFAALNLGVPARSDATLSAPTSPECADFQAALDFASTSSVFAGVRDQGGYGALVQTVYAFRRAADAGEFESLVRDADLAGCSNATAPAAPVGGSATFDLAELSGKDLQPLSDRAAPFLGTSGRLVLTPPGAASQTTNFVTLWLRDDRLVTRIAIQFDAASGFDLDADGTLNDAVAAPVGALVDAAAVDLAAAGGLVVGSGVPASALPWEARSPCDTRTNALVYGTLLTQRADGALRAGLATRWRVSDDGLTYTFTLADDLNWSDGTAVTADDMVFALGQYRANRAIAPEFETVSSVTAVGDHTVKVTFTQPDAASGLWALTDAAGIPAKPSASPSGLPSSASDAVYWWYGPGSAAAVGVRDEVDRIVAAFQLRQVATGTGLAALQDHTVDVAAIPTTQVDDAKAAGFRVDTEPTGSGAALFFNLRAHPSLGDRAVRRAIAYAVDREEMVEAALGGHGHPTGVPLGPGWGFAPEAQIPYDPEAARQLLEEAGYALDEELGVYVFDGTAGADTPAIVSQLQADLDALGVRAGVRLVSAADLTAALSSGSADIVVTSVFQAPSGFDTVGRAISPTSNQARAFGTDATFAGSELAGLLEEARGLVDPKERAKLYEEAQKAFAEELPFTFLYTGDNAVAWDPKFVKGRVVAPPDPSAAWGLEGVTAR